MTVMQQQSTPMIKIQLMGKEYAVPRGLTIMTAIEYAGYKLVRGVGCRAGFCGACPTMFRRAGDHRLHTALACQTVAEDGMCLVQMPHIPVARKLYDIETVKPSSNIILQYYPEIARCIACNTCTKSCPQDISVMDYIQAALRGDIERVAILSFDCIQCGICSSRCPVDIKHYPVGQLARRIYGKYITAQSTPLATRVAEIASGQYTTEMETLGNLSLDDLKKRYEERTLEQTHRKHKDDGGDRQLGSAMDPIDYQDEIEREVQPVAH